MDHFARLGLPAALDLDPAALDRAYFALQRQWHPDRFVSRPPAERAKASSEAAALNDAYRTLKDPLGRALYLAALNGVELPGDGKTIDDPELLMEAMEAREELHEATTAEAVERLAGRAREQVRTALDGLASLFLAGDKPAIRKALLRLRYLDKFAEEARARRTNIERPRA
ncbi:MAG: Fe-S protein assembly co-chaperone HscB [Proteobacteria bacterium]|nr:Fe-S protein assembly co-chaperone HscB [Pseudomonadota bacterium]